MKRLISVAAALVIISNASVLARVAYNRSGEPQTITLTERELSLPYNYYRQDKENSGLSLGLQTRVTDSEPSQYYWSNYHSFTLSEQKLQELGFSLPENCNVVGEYRGGRDQSRKVWLALEYDGAAHANYVQGLETFLEKRRKEIGHIDARPEQLELKNLAKRLDEVRHFRSRMYIVDISLDKESLQKQYGASEQNIILAAKIDNGSQCGEKKQILAVDIRELLPSYINVPVGFHEFFKKLPDLDDRGREHLPRYKVEIAVGKLNEPWLLKVEGVE